jgi:hypothetical protein
MIEDKQTAAAIDKIVSRMRDVVDELAFDERRQVLLSIRAISGDIADRLEAPSSRNHWGGAELRWGPWSDFLRQRAKGDKRGFVLSVGGLPLGRAKLRAVTLHLSSFIVGRFRVGTPKRSSPGERD